MTSGRYPRHIAAPRHIVVGTSRTRHSIISEGFSQAINRNEAIGNIRFGKMKFRHGIGAAG